MNIKKIGLTALAASLVSVSANAGELSVSGAASLGMGGYSSLTHNAGSTFSMGNQFTVSGSGELDNGLTVSLSMQIDSGVPFDDHSLTVASEDFGTVKFSGHGGGSAATSVDGSVAGDIWDGYDGTALATGVTGVALKTSSPGNNSIFYTLPEVMEGVSLFASYAPQGSNPESETGYGITYTGIEGLTASYATTDVNTGTTATSGDQTSWKVNYAYGPVTVGASNTDHDTGTDASDTELSAYSIAYTVSDELSLSYGTEELSIGTAGSVDADYTAIVAAYTSGGVTLTAKMETADNVENNNDTDGDYDYWFLGAVFAF